MTAVTIMITAYNKVLVKALLRIWSPELSNTDLDQY